MNMRHTLLALAAVACAGAAPAQKEGGLEPDRMQEIRAQKSAYLTRKMELSPEEAQRFWPIYNRFEDELDKARLEHREFMRTMRKNKPKGEALSDAEAGQLLDRELALREKELALRRSYDPQFRKELGNVKTWELQRAERDFHREMLKRKRD